MSAGIEVLDVVARWIHETLTGDATLVSLTGGRITGGDYPADWQLPLVTWTMPSSRDVVGVGGQRVMTNSVFQVKAVGNGSTYSVVGPIAARCDALLNTTGLDLGYGQVDCTRDGTLMYEEAVSGVRTVHLGGLYRVLAAT